MLIAFLIFVCLLLPFGVPAFASHTRTLPKFALAAFLPAFFLGFASILPGAAVAFAWFVGTFAAAFLGVLARYASLVARRFGHDRPHSLWIEAVFLCLAAGFVLLAGLA